MQQTETDRNAEETQREIDGHGDTTGKIFSFGSLIFRFRANTSCLPLQTSKPQVIDKQRRLGHRTFSLPDEMEILPAPATPLRKRILRYCTSIQLKPRKRRFSTFLETRTKLYCILMQF